MTKRCSSLSKLLLIAAAVQVLTAASLTGQLVAGRVVDGATRQPILLAELALLDSMGTVYDRTVSDHEGAFRLDAGEPGAFYVFARALGYRPVLDGMLILGEGGYLPVTVFLRQSPIEMEPVTVTGERTRIERHLEAQGFYRRQADGFGHFITPEEMEKTDVASMTELLTRIPGVQRRSVGRGEIGLFLPGGPNMDIDPPDRPPDPPGLCTPLVYVDGMRVEAAQWKVPGARVDQFLEVQEVLAVEVYTRLSSVPLRFQQVRTSGMILVWTK